MGKLRSTKVIREVAAKHRISVADLLGRDKFAHFVAARREAILQMNALGMTDERIAEAMRRERTTILEYRNDARRARKAAWHRARYEEMRA